MKWRPHAAAICAAALAALLPIACCGGEPPSTAADRFIAQAADDEEREALESARDDVDAKMRAIVAQKDAQIEGLRKENETLKERLANREKR